MRTTLSEMGPLLLARLLDLNETQEGVLNIAFKLADDEGMLLLDLKDLRALLVSMGERSKELTSSYGYVSKPSIGAIQRQLLVLEQQGGEGFFAEPALQISDLMRTTRDGRGAVSILAADKLMQSPRLYATFLLWLLSELFEELPEVGDPDRPRLVFFFDEAHLLFDEAPKVLIEKVEQVVKLIRSKGVGVYFVHPEPDRYSRWCSVTVGQPYSARIESFHAARAKGGAGCGRHIPAKPGLQGQRCHHYHGSGGGSCLNTDEKGCALHRAAHPDPPAILAAWCLDQEGASGSHQYEPGRWPSMTRLWTGNRPTRF